MPRPKRNAEKSVGGVNVGEDEVEADFFQRMEQAICGQNAAFCCGGEIPISEDSEIGFGAMVANEAGIASPSGTSLPG